MASTIVGKSGRVYVQGDVLQRHREDHKLSIFKAEYVSFQTNSTPFSTLSYIYYISNPSHPGPEMNLMSSSAYLDLSITNPSASQPSSQARVGCGCILIATKRIAS